MKGLPWPEPWTLAVEARWAVILQGPRVPESSEHLQGPAWIKGTLLSPPGIRDPLYQGTILEKEGACLRGAGKLCL